MNPTEVTALLACCASFDNRKPNPEMVAAWTAAIGDLDFIAAREAVVTHYQASREWIMPADIRGTVRRARAARIEDEVFHPPADLDPDDTTRYIRWLDGERRAVGDGAQPTAQPTFERRDVGELGVGRTNTLPTDVVVAHATRARDAIRHSRAAAPARLSEPTTPTRTED